MSSTWRKVLPALLFIAITATACAGGDEDASLIGEWVSNDGGGTYVFYEDGTASVEGFQGTYFVLNETELKTIITTSQRDFEYELDGDQLMLTLVQERFSLGFTTADFRRQGPYTYERQPVSAAASSS